MRCLWGRIAYHTIIALLAAPSLRLASAGDLSTLECRKEIVASCVFRQEPSSSVTGFSRLAVLVVGVRQRFYPLPTLKHVVAPAARAGHHVDYFALLSWDSPRVTKVGYRNQWSKRWLRPSPNPAFSNSSAEALQDYVARHARHYGAHNAYVHILGEDVTWDPLHDSWSRFLGRDSKSHLAFYNALMRFKKVEMLWNLTAAGSPSGMGEEYSHVLLTRDDIYWVGSVHMARFPGPDVVYSPPMGSLCARVDNPDSPSDHALVMTGRAAGRFMRLYSEFYYNPSPRLDEASSVEEFLTLVAKLQRLDWEIVRRDWFPYFLAVHTQGYEGEVEERSPILCLRGLSKAVLERPTGVCVHPSQVLLPGCDDILF